MAAAGDQKFFSDLLTAQFAGAQLRRQYCQWHYGPGGGMFSLPHAAHLERYRNVIAYHRRRLCLLDSSSIGAVIGFSLGAFFS